MINEFHGEYRWLSNFWPIPIKYNGLTFPSVENAYMSRKNNSDIWVDFCANEKDVKKVNKLSREIKLVSNWDEIKVDIMEELIRIKFKDEELKNKLLDTGEILIQEGNDWGDTFWGIDLDTGNGKNILGKIIMKIRDEIMIYEK